MKSIDYKVDNGGAQQYKVKPKHKINATAFGVLGDLSYPRHRKTVTGALPTKLTGLVSASVGAGMCSC